MADLAGLLGRLVAVPIGALARRTRDEPMYPSGILSTGVLVRPGSGEAEPSSWLDDAGRDDVVIWLSVLHARPGLVAVGPMARFRTPAYAAARAGRDNAAEG